MRQGRCTGCGKEAWVNTSTRCGDLPREFCADCFESLPQDRPQFRLAPRGRSGGKDDDAGPWAENAVRAMEDG